MTKKLNCTIFEKLRRRKKIWIFICWKYYLYLFDSYIYNEKWFSLRPHHGFLSHRKLYCSACYLYTCYFKLVFLLKKSQIGKYFWIYGDTCMFNIFMLWRTVANTGITFVGLEPIQKNIHFGDYQLYFSVCCTLIYLITMVLPQKPWKLHNIAITMAVHGSNPHWGDESKYLLIII